jgi:UDP-galactopyranose mutase
MKKYDYLIVGAGLFGAVFANRAAKQGKKCLVVEKRNHIAGNVYTEVQEGITVHMYGAHIFHTKSKRVWEFVNEYAEFNNYINSPVAFYHGEVYNLPFNMNTFSRMWGVKTPAEAQAKIAEQVKAANITNPQNLEEQAISMVGEDIYKKLVKEYTEKQWGRDCKDLPAFIIKRLPVRFVYDNNYFDDPYQGIPKGGYTPIVEKLLDGIEVRLNCDFIEHKEELEALADHIVYTGAVDRLFDYKLGKLEYRTLQFKTRVEDTPNFQGNAVVNYTSHEVAYTRIIEHKHFEFGKQPKTVITEEYPKTWADGDEPYYAVNNPANNSLAEKYIDMARQKGYILGGRLADYKYYNMDTVIENALQLAEDIL